MKHSLKTKYICLVLIFSMTFLSIGCETAFPDTDISKSTLYTGVFASDNTTTSSIYDRLGYLSASFLYAEETISHNPSGLFSRQNQISGCGKQNRQSFFLLLLCSSFLYSILSISAFSDIRYLMSLPDGLKIISYIHHKDGKKS